MKSGLAAMLVWVMAGAGAAGELPDAVDWLVAAAADPDRTVTELGEYHLDDSGLVALDPLTGFATQPATGLQADKARAFLIEARENGYNDSAAIMLVLGRGMPACGFSQGVFGVDTGLAALINRSDADNLDAYAKILALKDSELFAALEEQLPMDKSASWVTLPAGIRFPVVRSGYGDGAYELFRLNDNQGKPVALYVDFIGDKNGEWIDPPPCANV